MSWRSPPLSKYPSMFVKNKAASALLEKQVYGGRTDVCGGFHLLFLFISCYKFFPKSGFMVGNSLISRMVYEVISSICSGRDHDVESFK